MVDSGHTWFNKEDFAKAAKDLEASRADNKKLREELNEAWEYATKLRDANERYKRALERVMANDSDAGYLHGIARAALKQPYSENAQNKDNGEKEKLFGGAE